MKRMLLILPYLFAILILVGCQYLHVPTQPTTSYQPERTQTTSSVTSNPRVTTSMITPTAISTLTQADSDRYLQELISTPIDCAAPCFLGIKPGMTTVEEVKKDFTKLGLETAVITNEGNVTVSFFRNLPSGVRIAAKLPIENNKVQSITISLTLDPEGGISIQNWETYSPATLIETYGPPTQIDFTAGLAPTNFFSMALYFERFDLIVEYYAQNLQGMSEKSKQICPQNIDYYGVKIWMGDKPSNPPAKGVPLEDLSLLSISEFSNLLVGDPTGACFEINTDALIDLNK